jgi:spermidine synthase
VGAGRGEAREVAVYGAGDGRVARGVADVEQFVQIVLA